MADQLLRQLVPIRSTTGQEKDCSLFLKNYLESQGLTVELQSMPENPDRMNVLAYRGTRKRNFKILLNSHIDTVPPHIDLREDDVNFYGRGTCDAKGSISAQITAFFNLQSKLKDDDAALLYVIGEEVDHRGMMEANNLGLKVDYLIVGEPTESKLAKGTKGMIRCTIECKGKAAHSGYPHMGSSAVNAMVDILHELHHADWPNDSYLGPTTFNTGVLKSGVAANVIPENAFADITIRVSTKAKECIDIIEKVTSKPRSDGVHVTLNVKEPSDPVQCDIKVTENVKVDTFVAAYFTDIPFLKGTHKPLLIGPGSITVAHADCEFVNKQELAQTVKLYESIIESLLRF